MPTVLTFNSLKTDLQAYIERGTVVDPTVFNQLPRLINNAEREISKALKIQGFINNVTASLSIGVPTYVKPNRWRETISMFIGTGVGNNTQVEIFPRSYEYCRKYWPDATQTDVPEFYADYNYLNWLIVPTPVAASPWEINYYELPALLDSANQTNWLTDFAPTTLLYRALLETAPFLKNDERIPTWEAMYKESLASLNTEDLQKIVDRSSSRQEA
jgi:hypothetical protein